MNIKKTLSYLLIGVTILELSGCSKIKETMMPQCTDSKAKNFIEKTLMKGTSININNYMMTKLTFQDISGYQEISFDKETSTRTCKVTGKTPNGVIVDFIYTIKPANDFGKYKIKIEKMKYKNIDIKAK